MREVLEQEAEMFKIGDYVAHYKEGVCEVVNIGKIDMNFIPLSLQSLERFSQSKPC